jgi:hypothetical protein
MTVTSSSLVSAINPKGYSLSQLSQTFVKVTGEQNGIRYTGFINPLDDPYSMAFGYTTDHSNSVPTITTFVNGTPADDTQALILNKFYQLIDKQKVYMPIASFENVEWSFDIDTMWNASAMFEVWNSNMTFKVNMTITTFTSIQHFIASNKSYYNDVVIEISTK